MISVSYIQYDSSDINLVLQYCLLFVLMLGERPYKCKQCPKDFPTKDTFKKHMLAHTDERQYKCGECGKLFKRVSHAKEHLKIHTNERPFYCVDCRKYFRSSVSGN